MSDAAVVDLRGELAALRDEVARLLWPQFLVDAARIGPNMYASSMYREHVHGRLVQLGVIEYGDTDSTGRTEWHLVGDEPAGAMVAAGRRADERGRVGHGLGHGTDEQQAADRPRRAVPLRPTSAAGGQHR